MPQRKIEKKQRNSARSGVEGLTAAAAMLRGSAQIGRWTFGVSVAVLALPTVHGQGFVSARALRT